MARQNSFRVSATVAEVLGSAAALETAAAGTAEAVRKIVNEKTSKFMLDARRGMLRQIALEEGYVSSKMRFEPAKPGDANIVATIVTSGDLVILGHYSPQVVYRPAVRAKRAKGDPKRGVPPGMAATGVRVTVKIGAPKTMGGFTMTLRHGPNPGDKIGVFTREGKRLKHHYGIAPYSLFRYQVETNQAEFLEGLGVATIDAVVDRYGREVNA